ncbi:MAG: iron-containing redox enzyme family protein, partial [Gammaproteobacteria bacterium]|nr:iron-containing redox enzyme family protein [Gammaproteobacteria bacterium]
LCHYSSEKFSPLVSDLMDEAGLTVPKSRWYSNLTTRGNTGAASIFIMLADFLRERTLQAGERIMCFVPESGRFTVSCMMLSVVQIPAAPSEVSGSVDTAPEASKPSAAPSAVLPPHPIAGTGPKGFVLRELAEIWHSYRSRVWRTPLVQAIMQRELSLEQYLTWMECWIPQVREGSRWMRIAAANLREPYAGLAGIVEAHAEDEHLDYNILFEDYRKAGGRQTDIDGLRRNAGGDALNSYMHARAQETNPVGLLGGIYVIEGTGQRVIPHVLPNLRRCPGIPRDVFKFLHYHGENDVAHLRRWMTALDMVLACGDADEASAQIVRTATDTAELYLMQMRDSV